MIACTYDLKELYMFRNEGNISDGNQQVKPRTRTFTHQLDLPPKKIGEDAEDKKRALEKIKRCEAIKKLWDAMEKNSLKDAVRIVKEQPETFPDQKELADFKSVKPLPSHFLVFLVTLYKRIKKNNKTTIAPLFKFILMSLRNLEANDKDLLSAKDKGNNTALHLAACGKEYYICKTILEADVAQDVVQELIYLRKKNGSTPLEDIRAHFSKKEVMELHQLTYPKIDYPSVPGSFLNRHVHSHNGGTELMKRIKECPSLDEEKEIVSLLDEYGASISFYESDYEGNTALHFAILYGRFKIAKKILKCINQSDQSHRVLSARNSTKKMPHHILIELGIWLSLKKMEIAALKENEEESKGEESKQAERSEDTHSHDLIPSWIHLCEKIIENFGEDGILSGKPKQNLSSFKEIVEGYYKGDFSKDISLQKLFFLKQLYESYLLFDPGIKKQVYDGFHSLARGLLNQWDIIDLPTYTMGGPLKIVHCVGGTFAECVLDSSSGMGNVLKKTVENILSQLLKEKIIEIEDLNVAFSAADFVLASLTKPSTEECQKAYPAIADFFHVLKEEKEIQDKTKQKIIKYIMKNIVAEIEKGNLRTKKQLQACEQGLKEELIGVLFLSQKFQIAMSTLFATLAIALGVGLAIGYVAVSPISAAVLAGSIGIGVGLFCARKYSDNKYEIKYHNVFGKADAVKEKLFKVFDGESEGVVKRTIELSQFLSH